jgi:hypothetical protein
MTGYLFLGQKGGFYCRKSGADLNKSVYSNNISHFLFEENIMKTIRHIAAILIVLALAVPFTFVESAAASGPVTQNYGDLMLSGTWQTTHWSDVWDLTKGDLTLSYTIDMSAVTQPSAWNSSFTEVGIRQMSAADFNPGPWNTYQGGAGGWMASSVGDLTPGPGTQNLHDKHNLSASGGRGDGDYDATAPAVVVAPFGSGNNYGIWFDRDGVDPYQATGWGMIGGGTYNTGGVYQVVLSYHAVSPTLGTIFATINGVPTGFYIGGWKNAQPERYPAGLSFKGNMTRMQVFAGLWAPEVVYGSVALSNITVTGEPADTTAPVITYTLSPSAPDGNNGWYTGNVTIMWNVSEPESPDTLVKSGCVDQIITDDQLETSYTCSATSIGGSGGPVSVAIKRDATKPILAPVVSPNPVLLNGGATATPNASDATSSLASSSCDPVLTNTAGAQSVTCYATDNAGNTNSASAAYTVAYGFGGFFSPVDNLPAMNVAKAGQTIPLKWRLTDANGAPILNLASVTIRVTSLSCSVGATADLVEEYASGASGLQNLGDGYYQFNWKTPTSYANSCKTLNLEVGDGVLRTAQFQFKK